MGRKQEKEEGLNIGGYPGRNSELRGHLPSSSWSEQWIWRRRLRLRRRKKGEGSRGEWVGNRKRR